ncbi:MAG: four helix bundle protein [Caulobacteraceae bacterium]|nr:four helix bundle protein [Caulobacteraceae bacterium]
MGLHYRDLIAWKKAMTIAREVYRLVPKLPREETYGMRSQLTRAAISIPSNIAEGWRRESRRERAHFLAIAHGSLAETETLVTLCEEIGWFSATDTQELNDLLSEVGRILSAFRRQLRSRLKPEPAP